MGVHDAKAIVPLYPSQSSVMEVMTEFTDITSMKWFFLNATLVIQTHKTCLSMCGLA